MTTSTWIKEPLAVFDPTAHTQQHNCNGGLVVRSGVIVERIQAGQTPTTPVDEVFDASQRILLPGLINTHHHFYQTLTRAYRHALNQPLFGWLTSLYPLWRHLTPQMITRSTQLACAELLLSGCTTAGDHHYIYSDQLTDALDLQAEACQSMGVRHVLTRGSMSLGVSDGGLPPDTIVQSDQAILDDSVRVIKAWHDPDPLGMCQVALAPCSPFSVTPQLLSETAALANAHNVLLHTHLSETEDENHFCLQHFNARPVDHLEACGWLQDNVWFAHGIHFTPEEIVRLGKARVGVAHCPSSNMLLGSGICQVPELQAAGVKVGLGVDGSASNDHSNLIEEVRQAMLVQRLRAGLTDPASTGTKSEDDEQLFGHLEALQLATQGSADVIHRSKLGRLEVGCAADLALFELNEPRFSGVDDPLAGLILSGAQRARDVMVNGEWRVRHGTLTHLDLDALMAAHQSDAHSLRLALG